MHTDLQLPPRILDFQDKGHGAMGRIEHTANGHQTCLWRRKNQRLKESWRSKARLLHVSHFGDVRFKQSSFDPHPLEVHDGEDILTCLNKSPWGHIHSYNCASHRGAEDKPLKS